MSVFGPQYPPELQATVNHAERFAALLTEQEIRRLPSDEDGRAWVTGRGEEVEMTIGFIVADWRAGHRESGEIERELNEWLAQYVVVMDSPSPATRLKYPLRNGRVRVSDVDGMPGIHRLEVLIQPHLRFMRQAFTLSVAGRIEER